MSTQIVIPPAGGLPPAQTLITNFVLSMFSGLAMLCIHIIYPVAATILCCTLRTVCPVLDGTWPYIHIYMYIYIYTYLQGGFYITHFFELAVAHICDFVQQHVNLCRCLFGREGKNCALACPSQVRARVCLRLPISHRAMSLNARVGPQ